MRRYFRLLLLVVISSIAAPQTFAALESEPVTASARPLLPSGFTDELVATVGDGPTSLAFTPDGRLLVTRQSGVVRVYQNGNLLATPALNLASVICDDVERGLLGVAVDPDFANNHYIYLYYTFNKFSNGCPTGTGATNPVNRVSRFVLPNDNVILTSTETVLVDNLASIWGNHNAGDVQFGADGLLYISVGDGGAGGDNARELDNLSGKILRVNNDGTIPNDNPYASASGARRCGDPAGIPSGSGPCQEIFAWGLRNPFRIAFKPGTSEFYINDVGQDAWEEIDLGARDADYGWNLREGPCEYDYGSSDTDCGNEPAGLTNPVYAYNHDTGCSTVTGGAFIPASVWPSEYDGHYLYGDYGCGRIYLLSPAYTATLFADNLGDSNPVTIRFGPYNSTQALYYTTYWSGGGQVRRILYNGQINQAPSAALTAQPIAGLAPLSVDFDASASADQNNDPLTFEWDFGDTVTATTAVSLTQHTYNTNGIYTATVRARDDQGGISAPATVMIQVGNTAPVPVITFPLTITRFLVGQVITLTGSATDTQDGTLASGALQWEAVLHHIDAANPGNAHIHPFLSATSGNDLPLTAPGPEDLSATELSYLEIRLTATDAWGLATTITQALQPQRVNLTFVTDPVGLLVSVNNQALTGPETIIAWAGQTLNLAAASQTVSGQVWFFDNWSDSGAATHATTAPLSDQTYTATFSIPACQLFLPLSRR